MVKLPRWMQEAVKENVLTLEEAQDWHQAVEQSLEKEVRLPERLYEAASRVHLWETPSPSAMRH